MIKISPPRKGFMPVELGRTNQLNHNAHARLELSLCYLWMNDGHFKFGNRMCRCFWTHFVYNLWLDAIMMMMMDDLRDYNSIIQNIVCSISQINIKSRQEILSNSDIWHTRQKSLALLPPSWVKTLWIN